MASREKKVTLGRKQATASPTPSKEDSLDVLTKTSQLESSIEETPKLVHVNRIGNKRLGIRRRDQKKVINKPFKVKIKSKGGKVNPKLTKTLLSKAKNVTVKKQLLKNGVTKRVIRKKVAPTQDEQEDKPPVLEPIYPIDENSLDDKKLNKRKTTTAKKSESDPEYCTISATIESIVNQANSPKQSKKMKKPKESSSDTIAESIEDVVRELTFLIQDEDIKKEPDSDSNKSEKGRKTTAARKTKVDLLKKKIKKENIENELSKIDTSNSKVIDMLDLNVHKVKRKTIENRRHSIEKFPISINSEEKSSDVSIFSNLPRSISPKSKRPRIRQSLDSKRPSPYTTRSDSPARILRNGKHRKLKQLNLLDGLDIENRRRRRLCSDLSGSEVSVSKLSGYESDSSFSDLASLHGAESVDNSDTATKEVKKDVVDGGDISPNEPADGGKNAIETTVPDAVVKRKLSTDAAHQDVNSTKTIDTNSNVCSNTTVKTTAMGIIKSEDAEEECSPSFKVPDKSIILGIMKQNFNDTSSTTVSVSEELQEKEKRKTRSSSRKSVKGNEDESVIAVTQPATPIETDVKPKEVQETVVEEAATEIAIVTDEEIEIKPEVVEDDAIVAEPPVSAATAATATADAADAADAADTAENGKDAMEITTENGISTAEDEAPTVEEKKSTPEIAESSERLAIKTQILQALGLQSLEAAEEAKKKVVPKTDNYTGTLKTVIKLNRLEKKKGRNALKMTLQKKGKSNKEEDMMGNDDEEYKIMKEGTSWKSHGSQSSDTAGAQRKSYYYNRSNMDGSSEHTSDGDTNMNEEGSGKLLVIPEKASSFSIHPGRLCKDECSYCFGKFGLFDTPCHIAQMKNVDKQNKILATEKHLTTDSCLCDACYRHVDRKSNLPSYTHKSMKRNSLVAPGPRQNHCHVLGCGKIASNILRRKWLIKMRKAVAKVMNIDLDNPGLHSIPICKTHYAALEHLMVCAMCKRRLARNHIQYLGNESNDLNIALNEMNIPVKLDEKPVVCKLCRYFATLVLKHPDERTGSGASFFNEYKKRLLHFHDVELMDADEAGEPIPAPNKDKSDKDQGKKRKRLSKNHSEPPILEPQINMGNSDEPNSRVPSTDSRPESPSDDMVDYNALVPNIALECGGDIEITRREIGKKTSISIKRVSKLDIEKSKKFKSKSDIAVQRLGSNPSISVRQLFPGEEDLALNGNIEFNNVKERTPEGWEKCVSTIQYDPEIKMLWNELQKPYGNQSSFLRHLILLEKYFRNGDLVLSSTASHHSVTYTESVQNRTKAYDNISSKAGPIQPITMIPFNKTQLPAVKDNATPPPAPPPSTSLTIVTSSNAVNTNLTSSSNNSNSQTTTTSFVVPPSVTVTTNTNSTPIVSTSPPVSIKPKLPPGLISIQPGQKFPVAAPLVKVPQSQKIKFPITKNWRPNLIPIDPTIKPEKKPGLVQVISGGKPYHITVEDYKKMCAIKRTFDLRQKRLQEAQKTNISNPNAIIKTIQQRKGIDITKTSSRDSNSDQEIENSLEKLDKTVEKLEAKLSKPSTSTPIAAPLASPGKKPVMILPKIPKSLTVIPQTVMKMPSRPTSPTLLITPKTKPAGKS